MLAAAAMAQENAPSGLLRGDLQSWTGTARYGEFTFLVAPDRLYFCSYDEKTYVERGHERTTLSRTEKGDRLEVVSDKRQGSDACYARMVHVLDVPVARPRPKPTNMSTLLPPRANLTFSGVVLRVMPDGLTLRMRSGEHKLIRLRSDTRYLAEGQLEDPGNLRANTLVYIRAGRNLDDEVEAYQVVWGRILQPEQLPLVAPTSHCGSIGNMNRSNARALEPVHRLIYCGEHSRTSN
jgi:hypothetical protein